MKLKHLFIFSIALLVASCKKDNETQVDANTIIINDGGMLTGTYTTGKKIVVKKGTVTLKGYTYFESGSQLTIEPGTIIKSDIASKGALVIERGAKIFAEGTVSQPIVFTSGRAVGERQPGDWGGIIVLGNAPTNRLTEPTIEGGVGKKYGGTDPNDNSGVIKYVRIEFAGIAEAQGSEINGLTLGGVGAGTTVEYVQVTYGNDDAYEFFGGTVNAKYLVAYGTADDDFDFDFGYVGKIQHGFSLRNPEFVDGGDAGNGIECDNDGTGTLATPITRPNLSNFTILGPNDAAGTAANHNFACRFRRGTQFILNNSIILGHPDAGLSLESDATYSAFMDGFSQFRNNLIFASANIFRISSVAVAGASAANVQTKATTDGTTVLANVAAASLTNPFNLTAPNALPTAGAAALNGATFTGVQADAFFDKVTHRGAFGATNWMAGWTNFNFTKGANGY